MALTGLKILKTKHKKVDKLKKQKQREKNRISIAKRYTQKHREKKEYYKDSAWWGDFSSENISDMKGGGKIGGLYGQYSIISTGKTGRTKNEY